MEDLDGHHLHGAVAAMVEGRMHLPEAATCPPPVQHHCAAQSLCGRTQAAIGDGLAGGQRHVVGPCRLTRTVQVADRDEQEEPQHGENGVLHRLKGQVLPRGQRRRCRHYGK